MPNEFSLKPSLTPGFPPARPASEDPITHIWVPKTAEANLLWRATVLSNAESDPGLQGDLYTASKKSLLFWINAFVFTLRVFEPDVATGKVRQAKVNHLPMVTWDIQDQHILRIERAIARGEELMTDKSRDMGATWNHIAVLAHRFLFFADESHLMISRKEDAVDVLEGYPRNYPNGATADPGTLFGKLDYIFSRLPKWMLPQRIVRKKMHLINLTTKTRIDGESANASAGSSDRRTSIFLDEMAKMAEGESIKRSTRDVTACRLVCSTPNGAGTAYSKWRMSGTIPVFILPWWEHPEKGKDRYVKEDELGRWKIRSPWYDRECHVRSPKEIAIEVDMDHIGSGDTFFEAMVIEEHRRLFARDELSTRRIEFKQTIPESAIPDVIAKRDINSLFHFPKGAWKIWGVLDKDTGRLDQTKTYVVACDIGKGMGASNSTMSVMCVETREKVASFASADIPPYQFAKYVVATCVWVGGRNLPLLIWENNGDPGFDFGRQVVFTYRYPNIYFDRAPGTIAEKQGKRYGWRSSREKKAAALGALRRAYAHGGFINHDAAALDEALSYVHFEDGGLGPAALVTESDSTRAAHGDRVIADMLCLVGVGVTGLQKEVLSSPPMRSIGYRMQQWKRARQARRSTRQFNFSGAA